MAASDCVHLWGVGIDSSAVRCLCAVSGVVDGAMRAYDIILSSLTGRAIVAGGVFCCTAPFS